MLLQSGKNAGDENFPVGSLLLARDVRACVAAFYNFARAADDIADAAHLEPHEKGRRLDILARAVEAPAEVAHLAGCLKAELDRHKLSTDEVHKLLAAFRQDAVKSRYETVAELLDYCTKSADPVGRFLLQLHGEDGALFAAADGLCTALQLLNHLQDCADDFALLDRVYLPQAWFFDAGTDCHALKAPQTSAALRQVLNRALDLCDSKLDLAAHLAPRLKSRRLAAETAVIYALARRLAQRLRFEDPLKTRVKLSKLDMIQAGLCGVSALVKRSAFSA